MIRDLAVELMSKSEKWENGEASFFQFIESYPRFIFNN
jgi:hypothetical protein